MAMAAGRRPACEIERDRTACQCGCVSSKPVRRASSTRRHSEWRPLRRFLPGTAMVRATNARQSHDSRGPRWPSRPFLGWVRLLGEASPATGGAGPASAMPAHFDSSGGGQARTSADRMGSLPGAKAAAGQSGRIGLSVGLLASLLGGRGMGPGQGLRRRTPDWTNRGGRLNAGGETTSTPPPSAMLLCAA